MPQYTLKKREEVCGLVSLMPARTLLLSNRRCRRQENSRIRRINDPNRAAYETDRRGETWVATVPRKCSIRVYLPGTTSRIREWKPLLPSTRLRPAPGRKRGRI